MSKPLNYYSWVRVGGLAGGAKGGIAAKSRVYLTHCID